MKKRFLVILLVMASVFSVCTACENDGKDTEDKSKTVVEQGDDEDKDDVEVEDDKDVEVEDDKDVEVEDDKDVEVEDDKDVEVDEGDLAILEPVDVSSMSIATKASSGISADYDENIWNCFGVEGGIGVFTLIDKEPEDANNIMNVNLYAPDPLNGMAFEDFTKQLSVSFAMVGSEIVNSEFKTLNGEKIYCADVVTSITDFTIDLLIQQGAMTEEQIEAVGGRDALKAIPPTTHTIMSKELNGNVYMFTGSYHSDEKKEVCIEALTLIMQTLKISE